MTFVRFATTTQHPQSNEPRGIFSALYALENADRLDEAERAWFAKQERWFDVNLKKPERFARSGRPNATPRAIAWFKDSATEHIARMHALAALLRSKDVQVEIATVDRPGYIVYEDEHQVAAEPFRGQ